MSKVKLTQEQADFIQGFIQKYGNEPILHGKDVPLWVSKALHSISTLGFGSFMKNAEGEQVTEYRKGFDHKDKLILIEAIIHGYEVDEKLYYLKHPMAVGLYVNLKKNGYGYDVMLSDNNQTTKFKTKFTAKEIEENDLLSPFKDWKVEAK